MSEREILVGLNEGPSSRAALRWAAGLARRTGATVRALHALSWPFSPDDSTSAVPDGSHEVLDARYRAAIDNVFRGIAPKPDWILQFAEGDAGPALVRQSRNSAALALGAPEHVGLGRLVTGSVAHHCLSHAYCPVISVPPAPHPDRKAATITADPDLDAGDSRTQSVVVGLDSSAAAKGALAWAAAYARATGARLRVVHALTTEVPPASVLTTKGMSSFTEVGSGDALQRRLWAIQSVFASCGPAEDWELKFIEGPPERALLDAATGADLLVIGTREHRGVRRLRYGSVSHHCLSRSACPVVAVSPGARPTLPQRRADVETAGTL
jgi:nucleotide-binding universal stress UspA family protein